MGEPFCATIPLIQNLYLTNILEMFNAPNAEQKILNQPNNLENIISWTNNLFNTIFDTPSTHREVLNQKKKKT